MQCELVLGVRPTGYNIVQYSVLENKAAKLVAAVLEQVLAIGKNTIICFLTTDTDLAGF